ncbi:hypothetical protein [Solirhodobacter olei]|uniref:hypothetical protein n=1 Tax=Solirhodobacter olei TaxID=2493082 RepID=UPI000FDC90F4|nr:hypothetical protein [Solirhodobacter olei]
MEWNDAGDYAALIGGILYRNVKNPLVVNGTPPITLSRNPETSALAVSFQISADDENIIAKIDRNNVTVINENFYLYTGQKRFSVIRIKGGQVVLDLRYEIEDSPYELELSTIFLQDGCPVILHPERTKVAKTNDNSGPNLSNLTLTSQRDSQGTGIKLDRAAIYLLGVCIENLSNGVDISTGEGNADK